MMFDDFISLLKRHLLSILLLSLLVTASSLVFYYQYGGSSPVNTTVFISIGAKDKGDTAGLSSPYDLVQAADMFTETIQGWFKNKDFLSRITSQAQIEVSLSAKKQEKQNLVVSYKSDNELSAKKISQSIRENLQAEMGAYNRNSGSSFQIALFSATAEKSSPIIWIFIIITGFLLGTGFGMAINYMFERLSGKIINDSVAEKILGVAAMEKLPKKISDSRELNYLAACLKKIPSKNFSLIGIGFDPGNLLALLSSSFSDRKFYGHVFPRDSLAIIEEHGNDQLIVVKRGISDLSGLTKVKNLLGDRYQLIILE